MIDIDLVKEKLESSGESDSLVQYAFKIVVKDIKIKEDSQLEKIHEYIQKIDHPLFKPLYEYSLWIYEGDHKAALIAADKFYANAISTYKKKLYSLSCINFEISIDIYKRLGKCFSPKIADQITCIVSIVKQLENDTEYRWNLEYLKLLCENKKLLEKTTYTEIMKIIDRGFQYYYNKNNMFLSRSYLGIKEKYIQGSEKQTELNKVFETIAMTYETEAELRKKEPAVVCAFLKYAMEYYEKTGNANKIDEIKIRLKEEAKKIVYTVTTTEIQVPTKTISDFVSFLSTLEVAEIPLDIGSCEFFIPKRKDVTKITEDFLSQDPLITLIGRTVNSGGNPVKSFSDENELKEYHYRTQYASQICEREVILSVIFRELIEKRLINSEIIFTYLKDNKIFVLDDLKTAKIGIDSFFKGDFVSSIHILVPKLENVIRNIMHLKRIPTTISDKDGIREGDLGSYLRKEEVEKILGVDFNDFLKILLIEKESINLRNRLAHGLLEYKEFNETLASIILFTYLKFGTLKLVEPNADDFQDK